MALNSKAKRLLAGVVLLPTLTFSLGTIAVDHKTETQVAGGYPSIELFDGGSDILGRPIDYPECPPQIHSVIITMAPGQVGGVHQHLTPLFAYVLSGKISVTYEQGGGVTNTYEAGDAFLEAMHVMHHGFNPFDEPVKLLAVYMNCADG